MQKFKELCKRSFDLWVKKRWLKEIDSAVDQYRRSREKVERDRYVLAALLDEYKKRYSEDLRGNKNGRPD